MAIEDKDKIVDEKLLSKPKPSAQPKASAKRVRDPKGATFILASERCKHLLVKTDDNCVRYVSDKSHVASSGMSYFALEHISLELRNGYSLCIHESSELLSRYGISMPDDGKIFGAKDLREQPVNCLLTIPLLNNAFDTKVISPDIEIVKFSIVRSENCEIVVAKKP